MITVTTSDGAQLTLVARYITSIEAHPDDAGACFVSLLDGTRFGVAMSLADMAAELATATRKSF